MTPFQIAMMVIRGISTLTMNPALGGGGIGSARSAALLNMLATLMEGGSEMKTELDAFAQEIQALVDSKGEPTRGQWDAMIARDLAARKALDENLAAIQPPATSMPPAPVSAPRPAGLGVAKKSTKKTTDPEL
jgi:hypothetical protein